MIVSLIRTITWLLITSCLVACVNVGELPPQVQDNQIALVQTEEIGAVLATQAMTNRRAAHTATRLLNGDVFIAGGFSAHQQALNTTEVFDAQTRRFSPVAAMSKARQSHTATLLPDGTVLIAGGFNGDYLASAEIYNPETGLFTPISAMTMARSGHRAVLLDDGRVLIVGGVGEGWTFLASAELYDPATEAFTAIDSMAVPRESHTATLLQSGKVLITGGHQGRRSAITIYDVAELYDPLTEQFSAAGPMTIKRHKHDATRLADGRVFISGGADERDAQGAYRSTEIYNPETNRFTPAASMQVARYKHTDTSVLLSDGRVLLIGGADRTEIYNPHTNSLVEVDDGLGMVRLFATATSLADGGVLMAGGYGTDISADLQAWVYMP